MGKKHQEFGSYEAFNWKFEEFRSLLESLGCNVCGEEYSDEFECPMPDDDEALKLVKADKKNNDDTIMAIMFENHELDYDDYKHCLKKLDCDIDTLIESMETFRKQAERGYAWISFSAW